jgi:predicted secreted protein
MPLTTALAIFFLIWWVVLFAVLPFGVRSQHEEGEMPAGTDPRRLCRGWGASCYGPPAWRR